MGKTNPSIRDVAKAAGVSVATASRVLAKTDYPVAAQTRDKVLDAARGLGFVPNALARSLARARSDSIGVVAPLLTNPYYAAMVEEIDAAAREYGLTMLLALSGGDEARREDLIDGFLARQVDGVLVCAYADDHVAGRGPEAMGVPTVLIGEQVNTGHPIIRTDNWRAGYDAAAHLWKLGHRNFHYLTSDPSWYDFHDRGVGMMAFLQETGDPFVAKVVEGLFSEEDAYQHVAKIRAEDLADAAILASTDRHALGALAALADRDFQVPQDVSVMGFDDYITSSFLRPSLTTMRMPSPRMGRLGVTKLVSMLAGEPIEVETLLKAELIERGSTRPTPR